MTPTQRLLFSLRYSGGPRCVAELARLTWMNSSTVDAHLLDLERRNLIVTGKQGRDRICRVAGWVLL
jgi:DNA-binding MarR family transcriptional regulator